MKTLEILKVSEIFEFLRPKLLEVSHFITRDPLFQMLLGLHLKSKLPVEKIHRCDVTPVESFPQVIWILNEILITFEIIDLR